MSSHRCLRLLCRLLVASIVLLTSMLGVAQEVSAGSGQRTASAEIAADFSIAWLEPQGINIVDLVGEVPEAYLKGATIASATGYGIVTYESGARNGDVVTVTARAATRFNDHGDWNATVFGCLGQPAYSDQMGSVSPATTMRALEQGRDVTREIQWMRYVPAGKRQPTVNPRQSEGGAGYRYSETQSLLSTFTSDGQLVLPANMGCSLIIPSKNYPVLTLVFTARAPQVVDVPVLSSEKITFKSYLGPGNAGYLNSLRDQLYGAGYPNRADNFTIHPPDGADYFFVNYPAMPADPYTETLVNPMDNVGRPSSGTYRSVLAPGLSVDHVNSMGLPLNGHWQDIDQADGTWLRHSSDSWQVASPEYFLPPGVPYDPCMTHGGCSGELLSRVYNTSASMQVVYLAVAHIDGVLERLPVQMVGSGYSAQAVAASTASAAAVPAAPKPYRLFLPSTNQTVPVKPPEDTSGCSQNGGCGWFTSDGRMVDYIPLP